MITSIVSLKEAFLKDFTIKLSQDDVCSDVFTDKHKFLMLQ